MQDGNKKKPQKGPNEDEPVVKKAKKIVFEESKSPKNNKPEQTTLTNKNFVLSMAKAREMNALVTYWMLIFPKNKKGFRMQMTFLKKP